MITVGPLHTLNSGAQILRKFEIARGLLTGVPPAPARGIVAKWQDGIYRVAALIKDDADTLLERRTGNSRSYTLSRLKREALFDRIVAGKLSANAAAMGGLIAVALDNPPH